MVVSYPSIDQERLSGKLLVRKFALVVLRSRAMRATAAPRSWTMSDPASVTEKGTTVDGNCSTAVLNMLTDELSQLRQLRQEVRKLRGNLPERQQSPDDSSTGGPGHVGNPPGMRLHVKQCGDGSLIQSAKCSTKKSSCREAARNAGRKS